MMGGRRWAHQTKGFACHPELVYCTSSPSIFIFIQTNPRSQGLSYFIPINTPQKNLKSENKKVRNIKLTNLKNNQGSFQKKNKLKSLKVAQVKDEMDDDEGCESVCDVAW